MEGYEVITSEEQSLGHVVGDVGDNLIVEHGTLRKHHRVLPTALVEVDDDAKVVRTTVSKEILEGAPEAHNGEVDQHAVYEHYGMAGADAAPPTLGDGEELPTDPAGTADDDRIRAGMPTADQERAQMHRELSNPRHAQDAPASPGLLGGDRYRDAGRD